MSPVGFGLRLVALVWVVVSLGIAVAIAGGALVMADSDPFAATIWGLYGAALLALPSLVVSLIVGVAGWAWARRRTARLAVGVGAP